MQTTPSVMRNVSLLSWFNFFTDFVPFSPVAIIYFTSVSGSITAGMSIFSLAYISSAIFEVPTGIISDLVGRKKTMVMGAIFSICCVTLYAIGGTYGVLCLGALAQGISRAFYSGNNDAFLHDTLRESGLDDAYHVYLGKTSSLFQVALALSSLLGGILASYSFPILMWMSVIPQVAAMIISLQFSESSRPVAKEKQNLFVHMRESLLQFQKNQRLRHLTIASILRFSIGESSFFLRSAFINTIWPLWAVGIAQMVSNIFAAVSFYAGGRIIDRLGALRVLQIEIISNRIMNLFALLFPSIASPAIMSATSLTYGAGTVATSTLLQKEFTVKQRATMGSITSLVGSILFGLFSLLLGLLADTYSTRYALIFAHLLLLTPLVWYASLASERMEMAPSRKK